MSQYIHFFIRHENEFLPIATYSRSTYIYQSINAPYEHIRAVRKQTVDSIKQDILFDIDKCKEDIKSLTENKSLITSFNNSIEEKWEMISGIDESINESKRILNEMQSAYEFLSFIGNMISEAHDTKYDEDKPNWLDPDKYVYMGVECYRPTINDIEE